MEFVTRDGGEAFQAADDGEEWFSPVGNPFGHGCCDCGLFHQVEFCLVDKKGDPVDFPEGFYLALRFRRDVEETERLRAAHKKND